MVANIPDTTNPVAGSLSLVVDSSTQITVSISGQSDNVGIDHIVLQRSPNGTDTWSTLSSDTTFPYADSGLTASTTYYYRATVYDAAGNNATTANASNTTSAAAGFTHYVSPTGTASTWAEATNISTPASYALAMANAVAGNVVAFRGGTYTIDFTGASYEIPAIRPANSGTSGNPITFIAYTGETPVFNGNPADPSMAVFGVRDQAYIIWDGFSGTMANEVNTAWLCVLLGTTVGPTHDCIVRNCNLQGSGVNTTANNSAPIRMDLTLNCEIYNNTLHENQGAASGINSCGIWLFTAQSCTIRNNNIYNCENGIMQKNPNNRNNLIYHNFIHDIGTNGMNFNEQDAAEATGGSLIHDNLLLNCGVLGIFFGDSFSCPNYSVYNNTFANCNQGIDSSSAGHTGLSYYNNIVYQVGSPGMRFYIANIPTVLNYNGYYDSTSFVWNLDWTNDYSTIADWRTATSDETNSLYADPLFVNAAGTTPSDFALQGSSTYLGSGSGGVNIGVLNLAQVGVL